MPPQPLPPSLGPPRSSFVRVEYLGFENVAEHREFRLSVSRPDGSSEFRFRIAIAAFGASGVRLQDGPDVCYQKLLTAVSASETACPALSTIDADELTGYRVAHTHVPKRRSYTPLSSMSPSSPTPAKAAPAPRSFPRAPAPRLPVAPLATDVEPLLEKGQRVRHALYGVGVTTSSSRGHTVVCFDQDGPKTFVTALLKMDVLSAPDTWETGPRGTNRLRQTH